MANDLTRRPWILDTASASPVKTGITFTTGFVFRDYAGGAASSATIKDSRGIVIAHLIGQAGNINVGEVWFVPQAVKDLTLATLTDGIIEVVVK